MSQRKLKVGDTVYHTTLDLGQGKIRYIYREEVSVDFEKATVGRYPKAELCKSREHDSSQPCRLCGSMRESVAETRQTAS